MKASQKLLITVEFLTFIQRFDELDKQFIPLVEKLEKEGDLFGPVNMVLTKTCDLCISLSYADKKRGPVKPTIFGYNSDEFMDKQYK